MKTQQGQIKPTLESLGLKCTIVSNGISNFVDDDKHSMLKWNAMFHPASGRPGEMFDYYTGPGCVPWDAPEVKRCKPRTVYGEMKLGEEGCRLVQTQPMLRYQASKELLCRTALQIAKLTKWTPDPIEILWAIARDGDALESTFEDWASELGYDSDSRKAERTYRACQDNALRLRKILSAENIQILRELDI